MSIKIECDECGHPFAPPDGSGGRTCPDCLAEDAMMDIAGAHMEHDLARQHPALGRTTGHDPQ